MATFGKVDPFHESSQSWSIYSERLELLFTANGITEEDKKRAMFLTAIGGPTYGLIRGLIAPIKLTDKTTAELTAILTEHLNPSPSEIMETFKFLNRNRLPGESTTTYLSELRKMTEHCNFGVFLDRMLRDRFICGVQDETIQNKLLAERNISLHEALVIAQTIETAMHNTREIKRQKEVQAEPINKISHPIKESHYGGKKVTATGRKQTYPRPSSECSRCLSQDHQAAHCPYMEFTCHGCGLKGHLRKACRRTARKDKIHNILPMTQERPGAPSEYHLFHIQRETKHHQHNAMEPINVSCQINQTLTRMEVDTGSAYTLMPGDQFGENKPNYVLKPFHNKLTSFSGHRVKILGSIDVEVKLGSRTAILPLLLYEGHGPTLMGREWIFSKLDVLGWLQEKQSTKISHIDSDNEALNQVLQKYQELFSPGLGLLKDVKVHLHVKPGAKPKFCKARPVPYAMREKLDEELKRLEKAGIITSIPYAEFAAPIVPLLKPNKSLRVCGDYKVTANQVIEVEQYPLPRAEDIFGEMTGCKFFSKLDLREAYTQLELDEESKKVVVINTHKGLYQPNRLPYGVASASALFQRHIETVVQGLKGTAVFQDDLPIGGRTIPEHLERLDKVLEALARAGLKLRQEKCQFLKRSVDILGHRIDEEGLHPMEDKMKAIAEAPEPENLDQLRSFLGLLGYYRKFIPNISTRLAPLHKLLEKGKEWEWMNEQRKAFNDAKTALKTSNILVHYDQNKAVVLACDASPYGIGAVISHLDEKGRERPIAFASRTLTKAEKNYPHIEREALAIAYGVAKFKTYLLGRKFTLLTDHQPLITLFSENKIIPVMAAARIQRWALTLSAYHYEIRYKKGTLHANADALSRLPLETPEFIAPTPEEHVFLISDFRESFFVSIQMIRKATAMDPILSQILKFTKDGWPQTKSKDLDPYQKRKDELTIVDDILLWNNRVVVPKEYQEDILMELHSTHQGMTRMKALARSKVWWQGMDTQVEEIVKICPVCQEEAPMPTKNLSSWIEPDLPWSRIHVDFAGPIEGKLLLVVVDAYTKWIEVAVCATTSTAMVTASLRQMFARFGLPHTIVSDNATCFTSNEFKEFASRNGIRHTLTAPYHPQSNGLAERNVRTVKGTLRKLTGKASETTTIIENGLKENRNGSLETRVARFLINYRRTPTSKGKSPAELMLGRPIRTLLDTIHPNDSKATEQQQANETAYFKEGEQVYARNYGKGQKWLEGEISGTMGKTMYRITISNGEEIRRHQDQIRKRYNSAEKQFKTKSNNDTYESPASSENKHEMTVMVNKKLSSVATHQGPQPTIPVAQPTIPVAQPTVPVAQPTVPVAQPTVPAAQSTVQTPVQQAQPSVPDPTTRHTITVKKPKLPESSDEIAAQTGVHKDMPRRSTRTRNEPDRLIVIP